jgi:hypothetical protein
MNGSRGFLLDTNVLSEGIKTSPEPRVAGWLANADSTERTDNQETEALHAFRLLVTFHQRGQQRGNASL